MSEAASGAPEGTGESSEATGDTEGGVVSRPDYVPEKFWNSETSEVRMEDVFKSYSEAEKSVRSRTDTMRQTITDEMTADRAAAIPADGYTTTLSESLTATLPEDFAFEFDNDNPMLQWWNDHATTNSLSQEQYSEGLSAYVQASMGSGPNAKDEYAKLGDNGEARAYHVGTWAEQNLSTEAFNAVSEFANTAANVVALEEIMDMVGEPKFMQLDGINPSGIPTEAEIKTEMASDAYNNQHDPDYKASQEKVRQMWLMLERHER